MNNNGYESTGAHIVIESVAKRYTLGGAAALDGVSLEIRAGEFFVLVGPSGCGKTTLLRMLAGFEMPDDGRILIDGQDMTAVPPYLRPASMMFQSYALFPHMNVADNVGFGLRQDRVPRAQREARVAAMLELVKLETFARRMPGELSGGERQRVALARALAQEPKLVLLDEPLGALDRKLREEMCFELARIHQHVGITFLMVTHDQEEAMSLATDLAVMSPGKIAQCGKPQAVYENPASRFVAGFIGEVNLFDGTVESVEGGRLMVKSDAAGATLAIEGKGFNAGDAIAVAVRPEKISLSVSETALNCLKGRVHGMAYRGEASVYELLLPSGKVMRVTLPNHERHARPFHQGAEVTLNFAPDAAVALLP